MPPPADPATTARVALRGDYPDTQLELRAFGSEEPWRVACAAPCNRVLSVDGMEARITGPGMTPSKPFRLQAGTGTAMLAVNGGSASARTWGNRALFTGVPLGFAGMTLFGLGTLDERSALATSGGIVLGLGAALVLTALPLLASSSTEVTNADGDLIGWLGPRTF